MKSTRQQAPSRPSGTMASSLASYLAAFVGLMLALTPAYGAQDAAAGPGSQNRPTATASSAQPPSADLEAQLSRAREQLAQAARQVAKLSMQLGMDRAGRVRVRFSRGVIGLQLDPMSDRSGARVLEVSPGGPAADAGVRAGDLIVAVDGTTIAGDDTAGRVLKRLRTVSPNSTVRLRLKRGDQMLSVQLTTMPALAAFAVAPIPQVPPVPPIPPIPPVPGSVVVVPPAPNLPYLQALSAQTAGMELATLTPTLGQYFGTDDGVLVIRAPRDHAFQLQDGDVIVAIDGRKPLNGGHATRILASYQPGERITLKILRHKRPVSLVITLPGEPPEALSR